MTHSDPNVYTGTRELEGVEVQNAFTELSAAEKKKQDYLAGNNTSAPGTITPLSLSTPAPSFGGEKQGAVAPSASIVQKTQDAYELDSGIPAQVHNPGRAQQYKAYAPAQVADSYFPESHVPGQAQKDFVVQA